MLNQTAQAKKVVLVNPAPDYDPEARCRSNAAIGTGAPLGLVLLATCLSNHGFATRIVDGQYQDCNDVIQEELAGGDVLCVGFSVMSSQFGQARQLSVGVKEHSPDIPVVWGGFHPTIFPTETATNLFVDFAVVGEGEWALLKLCRYLAGEKPLDDVGNLVFRSKDGIAASPPEALSTFDELPDLEWEMLDEMEPYIRKINALSHKTRYMTILTGLGCNFRCTFCHNAILGKKHRMRSAESIVDEMNRLHEKYGVVEFGFADENFFADKRRVRRLIDLLKTNSQSFKWSSTLRANFIGEKYLDKALLKEIADVGGYYFGIGAESGNPSVLKKLKKGITVDDILNSARVTRDLDITLTYSFIAGVPGETCSMTIDTLRLIRRLRKINPKSLLIGPQVFRPYPGSPLFDEAVEMGMKLPADWNDADEFLRSLFQFKRINRDSIPWHAEPSKFRYLLLSFQLLQRQFSSRKSIALLPVKLLSWIRLKTGFYRCFIERPVLELYNKRLT